MNRELIIRIEDELKKDLPGKEYQFMMAPDVRKIYNTPVTQKTKSSSILIPLYENDNTLTTVLFQRPDYDGIHSGQVCFPGGKQEAEDESLQETAIREAWEEIGIIKEEVKILGGLTPLHIPVSDYLVYPWVGYIKNISEFKPDLQEVKQIIITPVYNFLDPSYIKNKIIETDSFIIQTPVYEINGYDIWGATAMIISELSEIIKRATY